MSFVHLSVHSEYCIRDSIIRIPELIKAAKDMSFDAIAVTDTLNMHGAFKFYQEAMKARIKPIFGCTFPVGDSGYIIGLCQNATGYKNLSLLLSRYVQKREEATLSDLVPLLCSHQEGLLLVSKNVFASPHTDALFATFADRLYVGLNRTNPDDKWGNEDINLALEKNLPLVALNDVIVLHSDDTQKHELKHCIQSANVLNDARYKSPYPHTDARCLKDARAMESLFHDVPQALANTVEIAKKCNFRFHTDTIYLPEISLKEGETPEVSLQRISEEKLADLSLSEDDHSAYKDRMQHEVSTINNMGFASYFLIVMDFIQWAKDSGIPV